MNLEILVLRLVIPVACTYGKRYVTNLKHEVFFDCPPYEWRSGTSDGLFLPIYPPRSMRVVLGFWWLVDFCNNYVSSLWLMLSPWIICMRVVAVYPPRSMRVVAVGHSQPSIIVGLFGTVHCPFSPRESVQTSPVHPNPVIWYTLSHISLIISCSK